jgi:hypothetical protein
MWLETNICNANTQHGMKGFKTYIVRFQVFTASSMKIGDFWDIAPCSLVEVDLPDDGDSTHL